MRIKRDEQRVMMETNLGKMQRLTEIDQKESVGACVETIAFLRETLFDDDYLIRSRCFSLLDRHWFPELRETLLAIVFGEEPREWQLRALAALEHSGDTSLSDDLEPLLFQRQKPLLIRGGLWVVASLGGERAIEVMARFLKSPFRGYLKPSFVADALARAVGNTARGDALWREYCDSDGELATISSYYQGFVTENPLLQVYPYPDYLSKAAMEQGYSAKELKRAIYWKNVR